MTTGDTQLLEEREIIFMKQSEFEANGIFYEGHMVVCEASL